MNHIEHNKKENDQLSSLKSNNQRKTRYKSPQFHAKTPFKHLTYAFLWMSNICGCLDYPVNNHLRHMFVIYIKVYIHMCFIGFSRFDLGKKTTRAYNGYEGSSLFIIVSFTLGKHLTSLFRELLVEYSLYSFFPYSLPVFPSQCRNGHKRGSA